MFIYICFQNKIKKKHKTYFHKNVLNILHSLYIVFYLNIDVLLACINNYTLPKND